MSFSKQINAFLEKGVLLSPDVMDEHNSFDILNELKEGHEDLIYLNKDLKEIIFKKKIKINLKEYEKANFLLEKKKAEDHSRYNVPRNNVELVFSYNKESKKRSVNDFVSFFNSRFKELANMLRRRQELQGLTSIVNVSKKTERENVAVIGMIKEISITRNQNIILTVEDQTGEIKVLVNKSNEDLLKIGKDLVLDEVIGITGVTGKNIIFSNDIYFPDIPGDKEFKKSKEKSNILFVGDLHAGSKVFLKKEFERFILWLNGTIGNEEQKEAAKNVKHVVFTGDLVEGVGVYPGQEDHLSIMDIKNQYIELSKYLERIPPHINIIMCPGNHDAVGLAEPQVQIYKDFAECLWDLPNVYMVSNPSIVNVDKTETFSGFDILLYHGFSLIYYSDNVESIRLAGGQKRVDLIMKFLLQKRHLAPTHESNQYIPDSDSDPLVINKVPDFFVTGHIHRASASQYKNITLINSSCWTETTPDQEKRGLEPQPGRLFIVDLQTRKVKIMNFLGL